MPSANIQDSLCIRLLRFLTPKQREGFAAYLNCSLFNTNTSLVKVYALLEEKMLKGEEVVQTSENLFEGTDINPNLFPKYATQLVTQLEAFVPFWQQREDPRHGFADAFSFWERAGLDPVLLERQYRKMRRKADKLPPSEWQWFHAFELEHRYLQYKAGQPRKDQAGLFEAAESRFDQLYKVYRLRYRCGRRSLELFSPLGEETEAFDLGTVEVEKLPLLGQAYYRAAKQLEHPALEPAEVEEFFEWFQGQQPHFSREDREDLGGFLLNICIQNANRHPQFELLMDLVYREMVNKKLLHNHAHLPGGHFKNIVSLKIRLGELDGALTFIEETAKELSKEDQSVLLPYTKGLVAYHRGEFREAVKQFRAVFIAQPQPNDVHWGLETRLMLWRSYYEILEVMTEEEHEEFIRQYDALRIYLSRRGHLTPEQKRGYDQFIRIFNRLAKMKEEAPPPSAWMELKEEVLALPIIKQRPWLCKMIDRELGLSG